MLSYEELLEKNRELTEENRVLKAELELLRAQMAAPVMDFPDNEGFEPPIFDIGVSAAATVAPPRVSDELQKAKYAALKQYFGYERFRQGQEPLIDSILLGHDALGIMPTGGGKSLCYQIPAVISKGITVVVSPLISLMKDQVMSLKSAGIAAAYINSSLTYGQIQKVYRNLSMGDYKIVYVAPERLETDGFMELASGLDISLVAVDEAHCISQWGQDFRPSYLKIISFLNALPRRPVIAAFTATATELVRKDIVKILGLKSPTEIITGFDRPNLSFEVLAPSSKKDTLISLLRQRADKSGIIYCMTRNGVEKICQLLCDNGFSATRYHAGLDDAERRRNQDAFLYDERPIMVATNAFGMGIDKSNVSFVVHYNMPMSLEAYYQEAGRAGRDGSAADCILLYSPQDVVMARQLIQMGDENEVLDEEERELVLRSNLARLEQMVTYCRTTGCLRGHILEYFGQPHAERCGNCGNCRQSFTEEDITEQSRAVLDCVEQVRSRLGYTVGKVLIADILHGSQNQRITSLALDTLGTYAMLSDIPKAKIMEIINHLVMLEAIEVDSLYGALHLLPRSGDILYGGERVCATFKELPAKPQKGKKKKNALVADGADKQLFDALRALRHELAEKENVPAYIIFSNNTLSEMALRLPRDMEELMQVSGVGEIKAAKYGDEFLALIARYNDQKEM